MPGGRGARSLCPRGHIAKCSRCELAKRHETWSWRMFQNLREFAGRCHAWGGGIRSRCVAACGRETPLVAGRRARRAGIVWRLDRSGCGPGAGRGDAAGGNGRCPTSGAGPAGGPYCQARARGSTRARRGARPFARVGADARVPNSRVPGCRYYAGDRPRLRPRQGPGHGADAARRGLLARVFAQRGRDVRAAHSRRHHQQRSGQRIRHGPTLPRLRGVTGAGHAAGARRLHARYPRQ